MDFAKLAAALRKREYEVSCFETGAEAANYLDAKIDGVTVGFGDSLTLKSLGIYELLSKHNTVYDPAHPSNDMDFYTTAPLNAARHGYKTPCAFKKDHYYDCYNPQRICNAQVIYWQKMNHMDMEIVLINESLGL